MKKTVTPVAMLLVMTNSCLSAGFSRLTPELSLCLP